ncbi:MAG: hypothetical protein J6G98_04295 [Bacilli bacterium]|nr:hypothetical protein [Bacilli bacterium]
MKCPNCNIKLVDKCCPRCGYLENGNKVSLKEKPEKYIDEKNINGNFDKLNRNENSIVPMFLGGIYLAYYKCIFTSLFINLIEFLIFMLTNYYIGRIPYFNAYVPVIIVLLFIAFRFIMGSISNTIILFYDKLKIKYYKKIHPHDYQKYLFKYKNTSIIDVVFYIILFMSMFLYLFTDTFK